jgi:hypothetical protein
VGAIFDGKKGKRVEDTPRVGQQVQRAPAEAQAGQERQEVAPRGARRARRRRGRGPRHRPSSKGPRAAPRGPGVFNDMLKKPCLYHKTPVNSTLELCDRLKRYYSRAAAKDGEAKKDGARWWSTLSSGTPGSPRC